MVAVQGISVKFPCSQEFPPDCTGYHETGGWRKLPPPHKPCLSVHAHRLYCLSGLCRPYGAKTTGISLYPPLTQRWESYGKTLSSPGGAAQILDTYGGQELPISSTAIHAPAGDKPPRYGNQARDADCYSSIRQGIIRRAVAASPRRQIIRQPRLKYPVRHHGRFLSTVPHPPDPQARQRWVFQK